MNIKHIQSKFDIHAMKINSYEINDQSRVLGVFLFFLFSYFHFYLSYLIFGGRLFFVFVLFFLDIKLLYELLLLLFLR